MPVLLLKGIPPAAVVAILDLHVGGWLVGPEMRSAFAGFLASILSAIAALFINGWFAA